MCIFVIAIDKTKYWIIIIFSTQALRVLKLFSTSI